jgi:hypothetical protein
LDKGEHEFFVTGRIRGRFAHGVKLGASELRTNSNARLALGTPVEAARCCKTRPPASKLRATVAVGSRLYFNRVMSRRGEKFQTLGAFAVMQSPQGSADSALRYTLRAVRRLCADGGAEGVGYRLAEALHVGLVLGFDHHPGEGFGAGIAEDDAAVVAEGGFGFG